GAPAARPDVGLNGRDVSDAFRQQNGSFVGLVTGLVDGRNELKVSAWGVRDQTLALTNYPIAGPVISGPHVQPFVCETDTFKLPDGTTLTDARLTPSRSDDHGDCSAPTKVQYVYLPYDGKEFQPLPNPRELPGNVATITTTTGKTVPFVVRVETGTMNRGIYQNLVLHDPTRDPAPTPFTPPPAWNRRFLAIHGVGCPSGWFRQGGVMGVNPLGGPMIARLGEGYVVFTNTLNHPTNSCNAFLAGETTMMSKEHAIETFGVPEFTVSMGTSGGAYTSLQIADEFPGLFDGILINATFPDALSIALAGADAHLLAHYFTSSSCGAKASAERCLTEAQQVAVSGYSGMKAFIDAANQSQRTDPVPDRKDIEGYQSARWNEAVPAALRYDPATNPHGARPTVYDAARNVYGVDPQTGFALRPFDNVGVQYGLAALKNGTITPEQFLDLNERIGGFDQDANYLAARSIGDAGAIKRAYQAGLTLGGGGGLKSIPVFDDGAYNDERGYHYQWFHFAIRERIAKQNGSAANHVMWRGPVQAEKAWSVFVDWVASRKKPAAAVDGCWSQKGGAPSFVAERQTFSSKPDSPCNSEYPSYGFTRLVAGGPLDASILKCQLKPVDSKDYPASFTAADLQRLRTIFPGGVCNFAKPGMNQTRVVTWASVGPAPENLIIPAPTILNRSQP
ncbi:MAG TPA: DUF6351 family protein, partial [Vicinamibacterales bacterium]|nr:DUF6351 family protein [Vicinamibacterales bacterium]